MRRKFNSRCIFSLSLTFPVILFLLVMLFQPSRSYSFQFEESKDYADTNFTILGVVPSGLCQTAELIGDHYIAVGSGRGIRILDLDAQPAPKMVSQLFTDGAVEDLSTEGNLLYIVLNGRDWFYNNENFPTGVVLVNVGDPEHPVKKSFVDFNDLGAVKSIAVKGNYCYVGYENGIAVLDATRPDNPQIINNISLNSTPQKMIIQNGYLFAAAESDGFLIYRIQNDYLSQVGFIYEYGDYVTVHDSLLFAFNHSDTVKIYSIADVSEPRKLSEYIVPNTSISISRFWAGTVEGHFLYLTGHRFLSYPDFTGGVILHKVDISNPTQPLMVVELSLLTRNVAGHVGKDIIIRDKIAFVSDQFGMNIFSIGNDTLTLENYYYTFYYDDRVEIYNNVAYYYSPAPTDEPSIIAFDISNPRKIIELTNFRFPIDKSLNLKDYKINGGFAYFGFQDGNYWQEESGVRILDLNSIDSDEPNLIFIKIKNISALEVWQNTLYVASQDTLYVYDVEDPENPVFIQKIYVPISYYGYLLGLAAYENYLYISTSKGLLIASVVLPHSPFILGFYYSENGSVFNKPTIYDNFAYLPGKGSLDVVNISNPSAPYLVKSFSRFGDVKNVSVAEGYVNVLCDYGVIANQWVGDTLITKAVYTADREFLPGNIITRGSWSYVAMNLVGLVILKNDNLSDVGDENILPNTIELYQNYPNPFNPTTNITYVIARSEATRQSIGVTVQLKVYDILGREVATLVNKKQSPGKYSVQFDACSASGGLPSGVYFYTLRVGDFVQTRKMVLLK